MAVTIYTTPTCPYCRSAKRYLQERGVPFREVDVARDPRAAVELVRKTGQTGVPVIEVNGEWIIGFDVARLQRALGLR
ncbi:MAG: glutathione S-transferase N-terminal domain-containing protein [Firmicutes bacterium]|nr:glutathione S-transferase N-terminal domain-containing protein [Bacillota bacterium]